MWVVTLAPASRQTRAAARSKGGGSEGARPGARCAVVAVQVKGSTAPAGPLGEEQATQEHPEDMRRVHKFGKAKAKAGKGRLRVVRASPGNAKLRAAHQNSMGRHRGNGSGMERHSHCLSPGPGERLGHEPTRSQHPNPPSLMDEVPSALVTAVPPAHQTICMGG